MTRREKRLGPCCSNGEWDVDDDDEEGCCDNDGRAANTTTAVAFLALLRPTMGWVSPEGEGEARLNIRVVLPLHRTLA